MVLLYFLCDTSSATLVHFDKQKPGSRGRRHMAIHSFMFFRGFCKVLDPCLSPIWMQRIWKERSDQRWNATSQSEIILIDHLFFYVPVYLENGYHFFLPQSFRSDAHVELHVVPLRAKQIDGLPNKEGDGLVIICRWVKSAAQLLNQVNRFLYHTKREGRRKAGRNAREGLNDTSEFPWCTSTKNNSQYRTEAYSNSLSWRTFNPLP